MWIPRGPGFRDSFCALPDAACVVLDAARVPIGDLVCKALIAVDDDIACSDSRLARCSVMRLLIAFTFVLFRKELKLAPLPDSA